MPDYDWVEQVIVYLEEHFREQPELGDIAARVGLNEQHLQRVFKRWVGISPKRFLQYLTAGYARARLEESRSVLDTAYDAGLSGPGRLHDLTVNVYAMTPGELKRRGEGLRVGYGYHDSPFGECLVGLTDRGVCGLGFVSPHGRDAALAELRVDWPLACFEPDHQATDRVMAQIFDVDGEEPVHLLVRGTNFQVRVWEALLKVPPGALVTYGDIAAHIGKPSAARAVGNAVHHNPIAYLIPCHRVIRSTGALGGYAGGLARKCAIIAWEAAQAS